MKPIIIKQNVNGKIEITAEELRKMVDDVYEQGKQDGLYGADVRQIAKEIYSLQEMSCRAMAK